MRRGAALGIIREMGVWAPAPPIIPPPATITASSIRASVIAAEPCSVRRRNCDHGRCVTAEGFRLTCWVLGRANKSSRIPAVQPRSFENPEYHWVQGTTITRGWRPAVPEVILPSQIGQIDSGLRSPSTPRTKLEHTYRKRHSCSRAIDDSPLGDLASNKALKMV